MLTLHTIHDTNAVALLCGFPPLDDEDQEGVFALAAKEGGKVVGFAVARSCPQAICFLWLEGDLRTCHSLVARLIRQAGERDVCGWCPVCRPDLRRLLEQCGFVRQVREWLAEQEMDFYYLARN
jgi:hypothetical protein